MNKVMLMGRLTRNPEVKDAGETKVGKYRLAVDRRFKKDETDFINCVAFGKAAEFAEKYLKQGTKIVVVGRIQTGSYTNREGATVYTTDVIVEEQEFAESKKTEAVGSVSEFMEKLDDFVGVDEDGLPFN